MSMFEPIRIASLEHLQKMKREADDYLTADRSSGWDQHRRAQLRSIATSTVEQRLEWLEDALRLALASGALARDREARARGAA